MYDLDIIAYMFSIIPITTMWHLGRVCAQWYKIAAVEFSSRIKTTSDVRRAASSIGMNIFREEYQYTANSNIKIFSDIIFIDDSFKLYAPDRLRFKDYRSRIICDISVIIVSCPIDDDQSIDDKFKSICDCLFRNHAVMLSDNIFPGSVFNIMSQFTKLTEPILRYCVRFDINEPLYYAFRQTPGLGHDINVTSVMIDNTIFNILNKFAFENDNLYIEVYARIIPIDRKKCLDAYRKFRAQLHEYKREVYAAIFQSPDIIAHMMSVIDITTVWRLSRVCRAYYDCAITETQSRIDNNYELLLLSLGMTIKHREYKLRINGAINYDVYITNILGWIMHDDEYRLDITSEVISSYDGVSECEIDMHFDKNKNYTHSTITDKYIPNALDAFIDELLKNHVLVYQSTQTSRYDINPIPIKYSVSFIITEYDWPADFIRKYINKSDRYIHAYECGKIEDIMYEIHDQTNDNIIITLTGSSIQLILSGYKRLMQYRYEYMRAAHQTHAKIETV